jgi:hypothetical protein
MSWCFHMIYTILLSYALFTFVTLLNYNFKHQKHFTLMRSVDISIHIFLLVDSWHSEFNNLFTPREEGVLPWGKHDLWIIGCLSHGCLIQLLLHLGKSTFYYFGWVKLHIFCLFKLSSWILQIVNMLDGSHNMSCTVLFSRFDQFRVIFLLFLMVSVG